MGLKRIPDSNCSDNAYRIYNYKENVGQQLQIAWQQGLPSTSRNPATLLGGAFFEAAKLEKRWPEMCELVSTAVSNRKEGIATQTAASSHRLPSPQKIFRVLFILPLAGETHFHCKALGTASVPLCHVRITPVLGTAQIQPQDEWAMGAM